MWDISYFSDGVSFTCVHSFIACWHLCFSIFSESSILNQVVSFFILAYGLSVQIYFIFFCISFLVGICWHYLSYTDFLRSFLNSDFHYLPAAALESRQSVKNKPSIKSYASVARGSVPQKDLKVSRSSSLKEVGRVEKYHHHRRERISSLCETQSHGAHQAGDLPGEKPVVASDQTGEEEPGSDFRQKDLTANIICRGQRTFKDTHIELIEEQGKGCLRLLQLLW